jgi:signal transduction histidine kinase
MYEKAISYYKKYIDLSQMIFSDDLSNKLAKSYNNYEFLKKKKEAGYWLKKNIELAKSKLRIEVQKKRLEDINNSKDSILNIVSHDLKNSVNNILQINALLESEETNDKMNRYIQLINNSAHKAMSLVKDILESNEIYLDSYQLELTVYDLNDILRSYENLILPMAHKKGLTINTCFSQSPLYVKINYEKFWQIVNNLISNAVKFSHKDGLINISLQSFELNNQKFARLSIEDNGIGIDKEILPILFDKFTKASRKGTHGENSTGLGLSIVKRLTELHKGIIDVQSESGKGSAFNILLPIIPDKS